MTPFGALLRQERERAGLSQVQLARRCSRNHSFLSRIESGSRMPSPVTVEQVACRLNLSVGKTAALYHAAGYLAPGEARGLADPLALDLDALLADAGVGAADKALVREIVAALIGRYQ